MTIEEEIVVRTSGMLATIRKLEAERDEWRKVADDLAAELDELNFALGDSDAQLKFKELENKYPL